MLLGCIAIVKEGDEGDEAQSPNQWRRAVHADAVDARNPANQLTRSLTHYLQGFIHPRWLFGISSINNIVSAG